MEISRSKIIEKSSKMAPFDRSCGRIHNKDIYFQGHVESQELQSSGKLPQLWEEDDSGNKHKAIDGLFLSTEYHNLDSLFLDSAPPFRSYEHKMQELADIESQYSELIRPHEHPKRSETPCSDAVRKLSTDAVIRLGGERFIQSCSSSSSSMNDISIPTHPYVSSFSGLSNQEAKDVELIENLLLSAEKVGQKQFERASKLLDWCNALSSSSGNPIRRLVHCFSKALRERISFDGSRKKRICDLEAKLMSPNPIAITIYQKLPFFQAGCFSGVQALVDGVAGAKKVHIIDLSIKNGVHVTILMQALKSEAKCLIEHLNVTAVCVGTNFKQKIEQTGDRLKGFAESINLSFSFNVVTVQDMLDFNENLLELDEDEALGVYSSYGLWCMIVQQDRLESLMKVIKNVNPRVMVVCEAAANLNSPNFVNRFIEALFFHGAFFDALDDCMDREDQNRLITESLYLGNGIQNIVAAEGAERVIRHVNIDVWRKFFVRFGMKETELSMSCVYQAKLMVEKFSCGSSCTFDMNGDSLVIGWKGTPIQYVSAWKFL